MAEVTGCSPEFKQLFRLAAIGATGRCTQIDSVDWQKVVRFAQEQAVLSLVACALLVQPEIDCPDQLKEQLFEMTREQSGANYVRKNRIFNLINEMEVSGFDVKLIKGYAVGMCYAYPECRGSNDTDLLIKPSEEKQLYQFMKAKGFRVDPRAVTDHHSICQHPKLGMVELHVQLYSRLVTEQWFSDDPIGIQPLEKPVQFELDGYTFRSLGYTDHLIFLTLHMVKHFVNCGMGIRMATDVAQFYSTHKEKIDVDRYWSVLENLHYKLFVNCVFCTLLNTGCYIVSDFPGMEIVNQEKIDLVLNDLQQGGHMGINAHNQRVDSWFEYSRLVMYRKKSPFQYWSYMVKYKMQSIEYQVFPTKEKMLLLYPILNRNRWLMPFMRIHRMLAFPIKRIREGAVTKQIRNDSTEMPEESKRRVEMFKALDMI